MQPRALLFSILIIFTITATVISSLPVDSDYSISKTSLGNHEILKILLDNTNHQWLIEKIDSILAVSVEKKIPDTTFRQIAIIQAIEDYQKNNKLEITGFLDEATLKTMTSSSTACHRETTNHPSVFSYRVNFPNDNQHFQDPNAAKLVKDYLAKSFWAWSNATSSLKFVDASSSSTNQEANIEITFEANYTHQKTSGERCSFDNYDVLAHEVKNNGKSEIHFFMHNFKVESGFNSSMIIIATHEIGHSLDLDHNNKIFKSIMYPKFDNKDRESLLHEEDIKNIRELYPQMSKPVTLSDHLIVKNETARTSNIRLTQTQSIRLLNCDEQTSASNESDCWSKCVSDPTCKAMSFKEYASDENCQLFRSETLLPTISSGWITYFKESIHPDEKLIKVYDDVMLFNYSIELTSMTMKSEFDCWLNCKQEVGCEGISFFAENKTCRLASDGFVPVRHNNVKSIFYEENQILVGELVSNEENIEIRSNDTSSITSNDCWNFFKGDAIGAISYYSKDEKCVVFKNNNWYYVRNKNMEAGTISITREKFDPASVAIMHENAMIDGGQVLQSPTAKSDEECWIKCKQSQKCVAISFIYGNPSDECHLYDSVRALKEGNQSVMVYERLGLKKNQTMKFFDSYLLHNSYKALNDIDQCINECTNDPNCEAVNFNTINRSKCFLYKENDYFLEANKTNWTLYSKKRNFDRLMSSVYVGLRFESRNYVERLSNISSKEICLLVCRRSAKKCCAISYSIPDSTCYLIRESQDFMAQEDANYTSITTEVDDSIDNKTFYEHENVKLVASNVMTKRALTKTECAVNCANMPNCIAAVFHRSTSFNCQLINSSDSSYPYLAINTSEWVSFTKHSQENLVDYLPNKTYIYLDTALKYDSPISCWTACNNSENCKAISFKHINHKACYLVMRDNKSSSFKAKPNRIIGKPDWSIINKGGADDNNNQINNIQGQHFIIISRKNVKAANDEECKRVCKQLLDCKHAIYTNSEQCSLTFEF